MKEGVAQVTARGPVNIAVIKYWGKRDNELLLPLNSSLSGTLSMDDLCTTTTVATRPEWTEDEIWLNGKREDTQRPRMVRYFATLREMAAAAGSPYAAQKLHIVSHNNFPTAAGLASSASGFACLTFAACELLGVKEGRSALARLGSGSATRSLDGGFVKWRKGERSDGADSFAVQVADEKHWPEMRVLICVASDAKKHVSSAIGMQRSVATSLLLKLRAEQVVEPRCEAMERAIAARDFEVFADLTMRDSDSFHAVCADTQPPIFYMNDVSKSIVYMVRAMNEAAGRAVVAYTFDAGPNAVLYLLEKDVPAVLDTLLHFFPPAESTPMGDYVHNYVNAHTPLEPTLKIYSDRPQPGALQRIISTRLGPGAQVLPEDQCLMNLETGLPK